MAYIFKPKKAQVDRVGEIVTALRADGLDVGVSKFYEYAADRAVQEYERARHKLIEDIKSYLRGSQSP